jgi:hypothetical protein
MFATDSNRKDSLGSSTRRMTIHPQHRLPLVSVAILVEYSLYTDKTSSYPSSAVNLQASASDEFCFITREEETVIGNVCHITQTTKWYIAEKFLEVFFCWWNTHESFEPEMMKLVDMQHWFVGRGLTQEREDMLLSRGRHNIKDKYMTKEIGDLETTRKRGFRRHTGLLHLEADKWH